MAKPPLVNLADLKLNTFGHGEHFAAQLGRIAPALRYLAMSTTDSPEICFYPDSGKYASYHSADGEFTVSFMTPEGDGPNYWDGED